MRNHEHRMDGSFSLNDYWNKLSTAWRLGYSNQRTKSCVFVALDELTRGETSLSAGFKYIIHQEKDFGVAIDGRVARITSSGTFRDNRAVLSSHVFGRFEFYQVIYFLSEILNFILFFLFH